jgi:transcriptional regulator with XRE-family HTH domain
MKPEFKPFRCGECGGTVKMVPAAGETREFRRGITVAIPRGVLIPQCTSCGEEYLDKDDAERIDRAVRQAYLEQQRQHYDRCVSELRATHGCTLKQIEAACGVTPTYFSHVMKGRRVASLTLTRLLEAFVACPGELARHLDGARAPTARGPKGEPYAISTARAKWGAASILLPVQPAKRAGRRDEVPCAEGF